MTFRPMLASEYDPKFPLTFPLLASPKLDGIRCVIRNGVALTRSLKPIPNQHIRSALSGLPDFDGEIIVGDPRAHDVWNKTSSGVMRQDGEPDYTFHVFDYSKFPNDPFEKRFEHVSNRAGMYGLVPVHHQRITDEAHLMDFEKTCVEAGYEGIMLRSLTGPYKHGRSTAKEGYLLKVKRFSDMEAKIVGVFERMTHVGEAKTNALGLTERGHRKEDLRPTGDLGGFICWTLTDPLTEFEVGSGFTAQDRIDLFRQKRNGHPRGHDLIGKIVKIKYQGLTLEGKPRFPVFLGFRDRRDMSDE